MKSALNFVINYNKMNIENHKRVIEINHALSGIFGDETRTTAVKINEARKEILKKLERKKRLSSIIHDQLYGYLEKYPEEVINIQPRKWVLDKNSSKRKKQNCSNTSRDASIKLQASGKNVNILLMDPKKSQKQCKATLDIISKVWIPKVHNAIDKMILQYCCPKKSCISMILEIIQGIFSQICKVMKKSTNKYRKCANCPHQSIMDKKCCCQKSSASTMRNRALTSRPKKQPSTIDNSSMVNSTIPTIIAEFSALRTENNHLKKELLNVSAFLKQDNHNSVSIHHNQPTLSQKLFLANKNLKQSLLEVDNLSKMNKQLYDRNIQLSQLSEGLKIQLKQMQNYLDKYKKKCKRYSKTIQQIPNREEIQAIISKNIQLQQQNKGLREEIRCLKFQNKNFSMIGSLSPEWVAHTNNKHLPRNQNHIKGDDFCRQIDMEAFKKSLSQTINLLKNQNSHFTSTSFDNIGHVQEVRMEELIKNLLQSYSQAIFGHFSLLMKQTNRKLNNYEKKLGVMTSKLQNFVLIFRNKRLKRKTYPMLSYMKTERHPMAQITNRIM